MENFEDVELYPEATTAIFATDATEILKKAGLVALGSLGGAFLRGAIAGFAKNELLAAAIEAGIGVVGGIAGAKQGSDLFLWGSVGVAAHGIGALIDYFMTKAGITAPGGGTQSGTGETSPSTPPTTLV